MIRALILALATALTAPAPAALAGSDFTRMVTGELRPGWRRADGSHVAALHLKLAPGWKTYWRAPGDAGIPPLFDWSGSDNLAAVQAVWPVPHVFEQSGLRSVGYSGELVLPLAVTPRGAGDVTLEGEVQIGICRDVCLPRTLKVRGTLPATASKPDPVIAAALAARPLSRDEAGVRSVACRVVPARKGLGLRAEIAMPPLGRSEAAVIETDNPEIWVSEPETRREGGALVAEAELVHVEGRPVALDRSGLRFTVIAEGQAVDIRGCSG